MMPRMTVAALLLIAGSGALLGCGGGDGSADTAASAQALADEVAEVASDAPTGEPAVPADPAGALTEAELGDLVCTALAEIKADIAVTGGSTPDALSGQFGLKTIGLYPTDAQLIIEGADAAGQAQCPGDRTEILAAAQADSLAAMLSGA